MQEDFVPVSPKNPAVPEKVDSADLTVNDVVRATEIKLRDEGSVSAWAFYQRELNTFDRTHENDDPKGIARDGFARSTLNELRRDGMLPALQLDSGMPVHKEVPYHEVGTHHEEGAHHKEATHKYSSPHVTEGDKAKIASGYVIQKGDSLYKIAEWASKQLHKKITWEELAKFNHIEDHPGKIYAGDALYLPK